MEISDLFIVIQCAGKLADLKAEQLIAILLSAIQTATSKPQELQFCVNVNE